MVNNGKMFFKRVFEALFLTETKTIDFIIKVSYVSIALISSYLSLKLICCSATTLLFANLVLTLDQQMAPLSVAPFYEMMMNNNPF